MLTCNTENPGLNFTALVENVNQTLNVRLFQEFPISVNMIKTLPLYGYKHETNFRC